MYNDIRLLSPLPLHVRRRYIPAKEAVPEEPWEIDGSVWTPRKKWADSKDYYDTPTCLAKVLDADWAMARYGGGLERLVMRSDSSGEKLGTEPTDSTRGQQSLPRPGCSGSGNDKRLDQ